MFHPGIVDVVVPVSTVSLPTYDVGRVTRSSTHTGACGCSKDIAVVSKIRSGSAATSGVSSGGFTGTMGHATVTNNTGFVHIVTTLVPHFVSGVSSLPTSSKECTSVK